MNFNLPTLNHPKVVLAPQAMLRDIRAGCRSDTFGYRISDLMLRTGKPHCSIVAPGCGWTKWIPL